MMVTSDQMQLHKEETSSVFLSQTSLGQSSGPLGFIFPGVRYVSRNIERATKIVVADSPPPYTICEYNLNFPERLKEKVVYAGHFSNGKIIHSKPKSDAEKLIENVDSFGYWMITGNKSTKKITLENYNRAFNSSEMTSERRVISHASADPSLDKVLGKDGKT